MFYIYYDIAVAVDIVLIFCCPSSTWYSTHIGIILHFLTLSKFMAKFSFFYITFRVFKAPVTPGLRPGYDLPANGKCWNRRKIVERTYDWSQRSWVIARAKSVAARSYVMLKPSHIGLTTRLRRRCDQNNLASYTHRRKDVRLVAEVVGDRKGQINRNKVDGHVQNM